MLKYYPVMMHTTDTRVGTRVRVEAIATRFQKLNGKYPHILSLEEMPDLVVNRYWYPCWVWDYVPTNIDYILVMDSKIFPVKPLPELTDDFQFAAVSDRADRIYQGKQHSAIIARTGKYYQLQLFIAHRSTRPAFDELKKLTKLPKYNRPDDRGEDQRGHMTPFNAAIQDFCPIYELPKIWNWLITYDKVFYTTDPLMINFNGVQTWAYINYVKTLIEKIETLELSLNASIPSMRNE